MSATVLTLHEAEERDLIQTLLSNLDDVQTLTPRSRGVLRETFGITTIGQLASEDPARFEEPGTGCGKETREQITRTLENLGLTKGMRFTAALKERLAMPVKGNEPSEDGGEEPSATKCPLPSRQELVERFESLGSDIRARSAELEHIKAARQLVPTAAEILDPQIAEREDALRMMRGFYEGLEVTINHYEAFALVLKRL